MALDIMDRLADKCLPLFKNEDIKGFKEIRDISVDMLQSDDVAVTFQYAPSIEPIRYYDRTRQQDLTVLIKVKHPKQIMCINATLDLFDFIEKLDALPSSNDSYEFIGAQSYTTPTLIDVTAQGNYVYSGMVILSFYLH